MNTWYRFGLSCDQETKEETGQEQTGSEEPIHMSKFSRPRFLEIGAAAAGASLAAKTMLLRSYSLSPSSYPESNV